MSPLQQNLEYGLPWQFSFVQAELVPTARELGIGFLAYSPLVRGHPWGY